MSNGTELMSAVAMCPEMTERQLKFQVPMQKVSQESFFICKTNLCRIMNLHTGKLAVDEHMIDTLSDDFDGSVLFDETDEAKDFVKYCITMWKGSRPAKIPLYYLIDRKFNVCVLVQC